MVELLSCHPTLPSSALLASYRTDDKMRIAVRDYRQGLRALRDILVLSGQGSKEFALHSLPIGGVSSIAAGGASHSERGKMEVRCTQRVHSE